MIGIVIVAHAGLANEFRAAVEHIVGPLDQVCTVSVHADDDRAAKQIEICDAADAVDDGNGVVLVADIYGGSPSNLSLMACSRRNRAILYGANLPMLIKLAKSRHLPINEAIHAARESGRHYINSGEVADEGMLLATHASASHAGASHAATPAALPGRAIRRTDLVRKLRRYLCQATGNGSSGRHDCGGHGKLRP